MALVQHSERPQHILVTGAAGAIGRLIAAHLRARGHTVRGFDCLLPVAPLVDDWVQGNLADGDAVLRAMADIDTVIHLGAYRHDADFMDVLLEPNVIGLYHVCDAARRSGTSRLVLASTIQTVSSYPSTAFPIAADSPPLPNNDYVLTKAWAEQTGAMYARSYGMAAISVRVGWYPRDAAMAARMLSNPMRAAETYLSPDDACRFFARCVESPTPAVGQSVVLIATSLPPAPCWYDLTLAEEVIGYRPQDRFPAGLPIR